MFEITPRVIMEKNYSFSKGSVILMYSIMFFYNFFKDIFQPQAQAKKKKRKKKRASDSVCESFYGEYLVFYI